MFALVLGLFSIIFLVFYVVASRHGGTLYFLLKIFHSILTLKEEYVSDTKQIYGECSSEGRALMSLCSIVALDDSEPKRKLPKEAFKKIVGKLEFITRILFKSDFEVERAKNSNELSIESFSRGKNRNNLWISHKKDTKKRKTLIYIHGGGFFFGSTHSYAGVFIPFAEKFGVNVYLLDYGLSPQVDYLEIFPEVLEEVKTAIKELDLNTELVTLGGDSAGGNLVMNTLRLLKQSNSPLFSQLNNILIMSPWCDLLIENQSMKAAGNKHEISLSRRLILDSDLSQVPFSSSPREFSITHWPEIDVLHGKRIFLNYGSKERLIDELTEFEKRLLNDQHLMKELKILVGRDLFHVYPLFSSFIPEGREFFEQLEKFM